MKVREIKAVHVRASNFLGGPEKQILGHGVYALSNPGGGVRAAVFSFEESGRETELVVRARRAGLEAASIPCVTAYDPGQVGRLRRALHASAADVVCTHDYRSSLLCRFALRGSGVPQVVFWRGTTRENFKVMLFHRLERNVMAGVSHVVVVSEEQRAFLIGRGFPPGKVTLVPNAVELPPVAEGQVAGAEGREECAAQGAAGRGDVVDGRACVQPGRSRLESSVGKLSSRTVIAVASRLSPEKGLGHLLDAMPSIVKQEPDITLLVFGDGPLMSRLLSQARKLGCDDHVRFAGLVPDFASLVSEVDVFVLPSLSEGLPNALLEAMAASRPVVATGVGGVKDLLRDGVNGLVVPAAESGALAAAVLRLVADAGLARRLGQAARVTVADGHSFARQFELLRDVYAGVSSNA